MAVSCNNGDIKQECANKQRRRDRSNRGRLYDVVGWKWAYAAVLVLDWPEIAGTTRKEREIGREKERERESAGERYVSTISFHSVRRFGRRVTKRRLDDERQRQREGEQGRKIIKLGTLRNAPLAGAKKRSYHRPSHALDYVVFFFSVVSLVCDEVNLSERYRVYRLSVRYRWYLVRSISAM